MSHDRTALAAPMALRFEHGHSTRPPTGSHTSPRMFLRAMAAAVNTCSGVPPLISTSAPAAMAAALPVSAWHPPDAPDMLAFRAITVPMAPAQNRLLQTASSECPAILPPATSTAGRIPLAPAVGAATIVPIDALTSVTASAEATIVARFSPMRLCGA